MAFIIPKYFKNTRQYMGTSLKNIIFSYLNFLELRKRLKFGPTKHLFCLILLGPPPPTKIGISERFQSLFDVAWNLGIFGQSFFENIET